MIDSIVAGTAKRVTDAAMAAGKSQVALSDETGIPRATLIRRMDGHSPFNVLELGRVAVALGVSVSSLIDEPAPVRTRKAVS